jgi:2-iminobutanoate/2-iminopropanoate deaminase
VSDSPPDAWRAIQPEDVATPKAPYSPVVVSGDHVYTAGQVALDASGALVGEDMDAQARRALDNVRSCLEAAGCSLSDVVKVNAYVADLGDFDAYNAVYRDYFAAPYPARTTVQAGLPPGLLVEIEAVARRPS